MARGSNKAAPRGASGAARLAWTQALQYAVALLRDGQDEAAERELRAVLRKWPDQPDGLHFLGIARHNQGHSDEGIALIRQALAVNPGVAGVWNNLGNVLTEAQRFDEAKATYREALARHPEFINAMNNLATILRREGDHAGSEALCRRAVEIDPEFAQAWYNLSLTLLEQGKVDEGLTANSRAIVLWPKHLQARNAVPRALVHLGRLDEAAQLYRDWLATDPGNPVILHHLAACSGGTVPERASDDYVERTFDAFAATFDANLSALGYRAPHLVADLLTRLLPPPARQFDVLDLGCGTGLCGPLVREWSRTLSGCDLSSGMLEKADRRRVYDDLQHAELVAYLLAHPGSQDALVCADTLCYFGELGPAMAAAHGALRPGGLFVFTVEALGDRGEAPYHLQPHGRYAHRRAHVAASLAAASLNTEALEPVELRMEAGKPVAGWLVAARRP